MYFAKVDNLYGFLWLFWTISKCRLAQWCPERLTWNAWLEKIANKRSGEISKYQNFSGQWGPYKCQLHVDEFLAFPEFHYHRDQEKAGSWKSTEWINLGLQQFLPFYVRKTSTLRAVHFPNTSKFLKLSLKVNIYKNESKFLHPHRTSFHLSHKLQVLCSKWLIGLMEHVRTYHKWE